MAKVEVEGNEMDLDDEICSDDKSLKAALLPFYPAVENASIKRTNEGGTLRITVTKRAGHKGITGNVLHALDGAQEEISPILVADSRGWKKVKRTELDEALLQMLNDEKDIDHMTKALDLATPQASQTIPVGF